MEKNGKHLLTIVAAIAIIAILIVSSFFAQLNFVQATTYNADNVSVTGVLATDSYVLYPYEEYNLVWGFSKYGEMINGAASPKLGLKYRDMDVFANSHVQERDWSQGWFIDIHYADSENRYTRAWAFAMYADQSGTGGIGGDWKEACTTEPTGLPAGGRKTNVWATTDPIKILYDGPRRFVALTKTTLYGAVGKTVEDGLVSISITFVFNKDKKVVILYKDIKRLDQGKFGRTFQVEFSNRGEWDIGITSAPPSYAFFYDDLATNYGSDYHAFYTDEVLSVTSGVTGFDVCQMINQAGTYVGFAAFWPPLFGKLVDATTHIGRTTILSSLCTVVKNQTWLSLSPNDIHEFTFASKGWTSSDAYPIGGGYASDAPMVFQNGVMLTGGTEYSWAPDTDTLHFSPEPADADNITIVYKHKIPLYSGAQTDNMDDHGIDEPATPYVIGEWCFDLKNEENKKQFRAVTVYGLTDRHDALDKDAWTDSATWATADANVIDCEVQYFLNETFNPYDLYSAVEKQEYRWVNITTSTSATTTYNLTTGINDQLYYAVLGSEYLSLGATSPTWTGYFLKDDATYPAESAWANAYENGAAGTAYRKNWCLKLDGTGEYEMLKVTPTVGTPTSVAPLTLKLKDLVDFGFWYKWVSGTYGPHIEIKVSSTAAGGEGANWANIQAENSNPSKATTWTNHYTLNNIEDFIALGTTADTAFFISGKGGSAPGAVGEKHSYEYFTANDRLGEYYVNSIGIQSCTGEIAYVDDLSVAYLNGTSGIRYERVYNMEEDKLIPTDWDAYCSFAERVLVDGVLIDRSPNHLVRNYTEGGNNPPYYTINFKNGTITFYHYDVSQGYHLWALPIGTRLKILYSTIEENEKGRYEWLVVGRDAATIDSLGAAYVSEAFDSIKDIDVLTMGMDVNETRWGPLAPFVMGGATSGTRADYRDSLGRPHLRDDWCTNIAVASSDMIFVGGPIAQLGTEYFNEFTDIFFASSAYVTNDTGHSNKILALSCWNKNATGSGYATIGVYKDLNGTIGLVIWGFDGQDTYYASKWFWDGLGGTPGIVQLQSMNRGVTSIMLKITYPTADPTHPTASIVERVGTISEKDWHDP